MCSVHRCFLVDSRPLCFFFVVFRGLDQQAAQALHKCCCVHREREGRAIHCFSYIDSLCHLCSCCSFTLLLCGAALIADSRRSLHRHMCSMRQQTVQAGMCTSSSSSHVCMCNRVCTLLVLAQRRSVRSLQRWLNSAECSSDVAPGVGKHMPVMGHWQYGAIERCAHACMCVSAGARLLLVQIARLQQLCFESTVRAQLKYHSVLLHTE